MNASSFINTNFLYSRGDFLPAVKPESFGRTLLFAILTFLFCIYVQFIHYTCSTYFLFFRVFLLAPNRPQQICQSLEISWETIRAQIFLSRNNEACIMYNKVSKSISGLKRDTVVNKHQIPQADPWRWCNGYRRRKWTRWHEFKSWTRLIAFHIALISLGKVWIQLFSLQLWVNSRTD